MQPTQKDYSGSTWAISLTTGDTAKPLSTDKLILTDVNIHVYTNAVYYGSGSQQKSKASANDVITFRWIDVSTIFFKNFTAGNNATIEATGVIK